MTPADLKAAARKDALARRKEAHSAGLGAAARAALAGALGPGRGRTLAGYMPIRSELDPLPVMSEWNGPVGVPVIRGPGLPLDFRAWTPGCAMVDGPFGAAVPAEGAWLVPEIVIVPLVAFSASGDRLGYGGGFYDRTLEILRASGPVLAVGFAYSAQEALDLPVEATDQKLDLVVTEGGIVRPG